MPLLLGKPENGAPLTGPAGSGSGALAGGALVLLSLLPLAGSGGGAERPLSGTLDTGIFGAGTSVAGGPNGTVLGADGAFGALGMNGPGGGPTGFDVLGGGPNGPAMFGGIGPDGPIGPIFGGIDPIFGGIGPIGPIFGGIGPIGPILPAMFGGIGPIGPIFGDIGPIP